jgi:hypothetical protein
MHMLIRVVSQAHCAEDATGIARGLFEGYEAPLYPTFDYGTLMTDGGRWSDSLPEEIRDVGSVRADSDTGNDLIEGAWHSIMNELSRKLAVIRSAFEQLTDEEILEGPSVEATVEPWNPLGLATDEDDYIDTYTGDVRYAMHGVGGYSGSVYYLYDEYGTAIRAPSEYRTLLENIATGDTHEGDREWFVTPVDVHY